MQQHFFTLLFSIVLNVRATITGEKLLTAQLSSPQSLLIRVVYISLRKGCWRHPKSRISAEHPNFDPLICASSLVSWSGFVESNHQSISSCLETYTLYIIYAQVIFSVIVSVKVCYFCSAYWICLSGQSLGINFVKPLVLAFIPLVLYWRVTPLVLQTRLTPWLRSKRN
jgi:hypothetical protein